jgi:hypothetical protein
MPNMYMKLCSNLTIASCELFTTDIVSIHLVNVSMVINKNLNPPDTLGRALTMLIS